MRHCRTSAGCGNGCASSLEPARNGRKVGFVSAWHHCDRVHGDCRACRDQHMGGIQPHPRPMPHVLSPTAHTMPASVMAL
jgi:hypothetical protein